MLCDVVVKDPNLEVQGRLELVFSSFLQLKSAAGVMRRLNAEGLDPARAATGTAICAGHARLCRR